MRLKKYDCIYFKNKIDRKGSLAREMKVSTICKPISMFISFLYVPIVLDYLGVEKYGIWATILSILSWINYFDIGIGNGLRNKLTESLTKKDDQSKKMVSSAYAFIAAIMILVSIVFAFFASNVNWDKIFGVTKHDENLTYVLVISFAFVAINFVLSVCKNVLYATQNASTVSIMELAVQVLNFCLVLILKNSFGCSLFLMAFAYGISTLIVNLVTSIIFYYRHREVRPSLKHIDISVGKSITNLGIQFFLIQICALVLFSTDSLIISYLYGAADVTPYNTVNKLFNIIIAIYSAMISPVWNNVCKLKAEKDFGGIEKLIKHLNIAMIPYFIGTIGVVFIMRPATKIWLGRDLDYSTALILGGAMYCLLTIWCNTYASISNGLQILKSSIVLACAQAVLNIPISIIMAEGLGMRSAGVLSGTCVVMILAAVIIPIIVKKRIKELKNEKV